MTLTDPINRPYPDGHPPFMFLTLCEVASLKAWNYFQFRFLIPLGTFYTWSQAKPEKIKIFGTFQLKPFWAYKNIMF